MKKYFSKISSLTVACCCIPTFFSSCSNNSIYFKEGEDVWLPFDNDEAWGTDIFKTTLKLTNLNPDEKSSYLFWASNNFGKQFQNWYDSISGHGIYDWKTEVIDDKTFVQLDECKSIFLYANMIPYKINGPLHLKEPVPSPIKETFVDIPGTEFTGDYWIDTIKTYKLIDLALSKGRAPIDFTTYHGVEMVEKEILPQIKDFINIDPAKGIYDVKGCINHTFKMNGYTSCAMNPWWCANFLYDTTLEPSQQEKSALLIPTLCKVKIPKDTICAYINYFPKMHNLARTDLETQTIIARNTTFLIENAVVMDLPYTHWCKYAKPKGIENQISYKALYLTIKVVNQD